ncbi:MAG TPA: class I SAM-dependent methyltransferase [Blastocatellia bacterium]|nr:class I SAM-dependent methyltransferase [Blastocatellia bacterium]
MHQYSGPHDYFDETYVNEWAENAGTRRPFRVQFFETFAAELKRLETPSVLELGSGPGFLAEYLLNHCDLASYHLLDFSPHMLDLSRRRLAPFADKTRNYQSSFLDEEWWQAIPGPFDAIVSMQAVHEVRRADRIKRLYAQLKLLLRPTGLILIADQVNSDNKQEPQFLTSAEHIAALNQAGFESARQIFAAGDLVMFAAARPLVDQVDGRNSHLQSRALGNATRI